MSSSTLLFTSPTSNVESGWAVDQAILSEEERVVVMRFGHDWDPDCIKQDEVLFAVAEKVKNMAAIYVVDITEVNDFNKMYEFHIETSSECQNRRLRPLNGGFTPQNNN
eukprot:gene2958-3400_t